MESINIGHDRMSKSSLQMQQGDLCLVTVGHATSRCRLQISSCRWVPCASHSAVFPRRQETQISPVAPSDGRVCGGCFAHGTWVVTRHQKLHMEFLCSNPVACEI